MILDLGGKIGETPLRLPSSFASRLDLVTAWSDSPNRTELARLCAASILICSSINDAPRYRVESGKPIQFGGSAIDWLVSRDVTPSRIYKAGPKIISKILESIPSEEEVEDAEDFSEAVGEE